MCIYDKSVIKKELSENKQQDFIKIMIRFKEHDKMDLIFELIRDNIL